MWFSSFFENAFVNLVKRLMPILMLRFWRSTYDVLMCSGSGLPTNDFAICTEADGRAVSLLCFRRDPVMFDQHRVIDVTVKGRVYCAQVSFVTIRR